jgi:Ulp1 family protease
LLDDENDYVRLPLLESLIPFSQVCVEKSPEEFVAILERIIADKSIKVRSSIIDFVEDMHRAFPESVVNDILIPTYLSYINPDAENELKNRVLINIVSLYTNIPNFDELFLPKLKILSKDKSLSVK